MRKIYINKYQLSLPSHQHTAVALPWELLYADDLAVIAETEEELIKRLNEWKGNVDSKGMRVNMNKTKVMISGERQMVYAVSGYLPTV